MASSTVGSLTDQILAEIESGLSHQRHKWAAQCQAHGLSMTHFHVLSILEAEGPTPMSQLADQLGMADSNVTGIVGRMEERGVIERIHDGEDRRVVLAQLTGMGRDLVQRLERARFEHMRQLVNALTPDEQQTVLGALKTLTSAHARVHEAAYDHPEPSTHSHKELLRS